MTRTRDNLICCVIALTALGVVVGHSVATAHADHLQGAYRVLLKRVIFLGLGVAAMALAATVDYRFWRRRRWPIYAGAILLLVLVLIPGVGVERNHARRWFRVAGFSCQPSEFAKIALVVAVAAFAARRRAELGRFWKGLAPGLALVGLPAALILVEPDFGTATLVAAIGALILLVGGAKLWHMVVLAAPGLAAAVALVAGSPYRRGRILAFLRPWEHYDGPGYQLIHSLLALGSGGLLGLGPGGSQQKLYFLPESSTDFAFAILGEELGLVGALAALGLFVYFVVLGMRVAGNAPDLFGSLLAFGITSVIGLQAAINIAVVTASAPTKGIPLPFISAGGTSLVVTLASVGVLLNVAAQAEAALARETRIQAEGAIG